MAENCMFLYMLHDVSYICIAPVALSCTGHIVVIWSNCYHNGLWCGRSKHLKTALSRSCGSCSSWRKELLAELIITWTCAISCTNRTKTWCTFEEASHPRAGKRFSFTFGHPYPLDPPPCSRCFAIWSEITVSRGARFADRQFGGDRVTHQAALQAKWLVR